MQTPDYESPATARQSKLAVAALVYSMIAGPASPILTLLIFGDVDEPRFMTAAQRHLLFGLWFVLVGVAIGLVAVIRARKFSLRGMPLAYCGISLSIIWALVQIAVYMQIF